MIAAIKNNLKNLIGWKTNKKIIVFSVDDYGNVRLDSAEARKNLDDAGMKIHSRFDVFDTLETREDLEMLFDSLSSVKDKNGNSAVLTAFAVPCNIDFELMQKEEFSEYHYELLPVTFEKLTIKNSTAYQGAWQLWKEGLNEKIIIPQFHGREHLNLKVFNEKLINRDFELLTNLKNRSFTNISSSGYQSISYTAAFDFYKFEENKNFVSIIQDGTNAFENVFGFRASHFTPPAYNIHSTNFSVLKDCGIDFIDLAMFQKEHQGLNKYKHHFNYLGKQIDENLLAIIRNVVFEPTDDRGIDWIAYSLQQIETAFLWKRPAIISSHRVNFCGHIDAENRKIGIDALSQLLKEIVQRWPDVEFMAANELGNLIKQEKNIQ